jgi:hypothetical protein
MLRVLGLPIFALLLTALPASAQKILPDRFGSWQSELEGTSVDPRHFYPSSAADAANNDAIMKEYGLASEEETGYASNAPGAIEAAKKAHSVQSLQVTLYHMKDPSGAYGLYSFLRSPDMSRSDLTEHSSISDSRALILDGNLVLEIKDSNLLSLKKDLRSLVAVVQQHAEDGALPTLPLYLPEDHRVGGSDKYVLGPQALDEVFPAGIGNGVGFQRSAEAEVAHYRVGGRDEALLIVGFPTDQLAAAQLSELQKNFNVNGAGPLPGTPLFAKRSARLLAIVAGATSQAEANTLLDQIQMETERSWNEPVPKHEPPIEMMIEGSIIGALSICLFALVAGFSFGGLRLIVKRLAPGKVFDRSADLQVLQLGLGSKPINSDDFYGYTGSSGPAPAVDKNLPDRVALRIFR